MFLAAAFHAASPVLDPSAYARAEKAAAAAARSEPGGRGTKWKTSKRRKNMQVSSSYSQEVEKFSTNGSHEIRFLTAEEGEEEGSDSGDTMVCRVWECRNDRWLPCGSCGTDWKKPNLKIDDDFQVSD